MECEAASVSSTSKATSSSTSLATSGVAIGATSGGGGGAGSPFPSSFVPTQSMMSKTDRDQFINFLTRFIIQVSLLLVRYLIRTY